jgi:hypothetical protein
MTWIHDEEANETILEIVIDGIAQAERYDFHPQLSADFITWDEALDGDYSVIAENDSVRARLNVTNLQLQYIRFRVALRSE